MTRLLLAILFLTPMLSFAATDINVKLCVPRSGVYQFEIEVNRHSSIPSFSSGEAIISCKSLSSLYLEENFAEDFWSQTNAPGDITSVIGSNYDSRYVLGALHYPENVDFVSSEIICAGMSKPFLFVNRHSKIPSFGSDKRNLISENCKVLNTTYFRTTNVVQGVYQIERFGAGKDYLVDVLGLSKNSFVSFSDLWAD